jgi:hypothetical protein
MAVFGMDDLIPAIQMNVVDVVLLDPHWYGGVSRARLAGDCLKKQLNSVIRSPPLRSSI